ncbi:MAG: zinc carboxypeptidase [Flavobacteriaceae bacterium]|nr:zinc carboxypeptidase [Flavobacteriaceae bacterium]
MKKIDTGKIAAWHSKYKEGLLTGRYITTSMIEPVIKNLSSRFQIESRAQSHEGLPIYKIVVGTGPVKILIWTQMHGNESTGTKAVFDLFRYIDNSPDETEINRLLSACTLIVIPILNPDGALAYTRVNAQGIDLNRDAVDHQAPESRYLYEVLQSEQPDYCFNLHDQRTIFSVGRKNAPATLSFLAPSEDADRTLTEGRKKTMAVISAIYNTLKQVLSGQIGRFTDEFYPTATGDNFQKMGFPTILIEAGHYTGDYAREKVRFYNFLALLTGIRFITSPKRSTAFKSYFKIPENKQLRFDIIYKNIVLDDSCEKTDAGILFKEVLTGDKISFQPYIARIENLSAYNADKIIDKKGKTFKSKNSLEALIKK